jgi:hypothetical protein
MRGATCIWVDFVEKRAPAQIEGWIAVIVTVRRRTKTALQYLWRESRLGRMYTKARLVGVAGPAPILFGGLEIGEEIGDGIDGRA